MGPNRTVMFQLRGFGDFQHDEMPKGELFRFGVNPYTGVVVVTFQDRHPLAGEIINRVLNQINADTRMMRIKGHEGDMHDFADYLEGLIQEDLTPVVLDCLNKQDDVYKAARAS